MKLNIKKFADLSGVSVRTLHYYDEIDLLKPEFVDEQNGYRFYGEKSFSRMQEILFYRELDFSLKDIKKIISSPNYNKKEALQGQKSLLVLKKERLEKIINAIEAAQKGDYGMNFDAFSRNEFNNQKEIYKDEVKSRWGDTEAFKENVQKTAEYSPEKEQEFAEGLNRIIAEFADAMKARVKESDEITVSLAEKLKNFITETQYTCTDEILLSLGEMYVADERFKKNIDKFGDGTAEYMSKAIKEYCKSNI